MAKKAKKTASRGGFPWVASSAVLLLSIIGLLVYDVTSAGSFPKSATGKFLQDAGLLEQTQAVWKRTLVLSARSYVWVETNVPIYYNQGAEISKPYRALAYDLYLIGSEQVGKMYNNTREYVVSTAPVVYSTVDQYVPGALDTVGKYAVQGRDVVWDFTATNYGKFRDYLHSGVLVGDWAPEVLQNKTLTALNSTRSFVTQYYSWFHEQVHLYSKTQ